MAVPFFDPNLLVFGYLGVFLVGLGLGIIPFFGPSNMVIAFAIMTLWPVPADQMLMHLFMVSLAISLGVSLAKAVHYYVMIQSRRLLSEERRKKLDHAKVRIGRWASFAVFLAASTPIPDEPIVFTIGLMKYSWVKFLLAFFAGKIVVTLAGGYIGVVLGQTITELAGGDMFLLISIIATIILTGTLLAWSFEKAARRGEDEDTKSGASKKKELKQEKKAKDTQSKGST